MAEDSGISWTDATYNPWIGCTKVSNDPLTGACVNCYAERENNQRKWTLGFGPGIPRKRTKTAGDVRRWNRQHPEFFAAKGRKRIVFCASLADVFDNEVEQAWRDDLFQLIGETRNIGWILLTKRIGNAVKMIPWNTPLHHVGIMSTIVTQAEWDRDYPKLREVYRDLGFGWHGVSDEPTLAPIDMGDAKPDWMITGGESGPDGERRDLNFDNARMIRDQCIPRGIAYHHKQNGGRRGKDTGCLLDGVEYKQFPAQLR